MKTISLTETQFDEMLAKCLPGGSSCDPQNVADELREFFAAQPETGWSD